MNTKRSEFKDNRLANRSGSNGRPGGWNLRRMPLLGRHKSPAGSSSQQQPQQQQASNTTNNNSTLPNQTRARQPLCQSPLFGFRRQLPLGDGGSAGSGSATGASGKQAAASSSNTNTCDASEPLSSVPQQITRQQINYAFSIMDTNKDGMIDLRDLSQMLANLGIPIDEAILSHIMSSVSKRGVVEPSSCVQWEAQLCSLVADFWPPGDHRISEAEFLDWISRFIQVSDSPTLGCGRDRRQQADHQQGKQPPPPPSQGRRRLPGLTGGSSSNSAATGKSRVARSSTASSSLAAQPSEMPRNRRGSGSGLALMRSLSASNTAAGATDQLAESTGSGLLASSASSEQRQQLQQQEPSSSADQEARNDLKAAFGVFDLDGDGFITIDEVRAGLKLLGESWSPSELQQVFSRCSGGGIGAQGLSRQSNSGDLSGQRISIDDFVQLLL